MKEVIATISFLVIALMSGSSQKTDTVAKATAQVADTTEMPGTNALKKELPLGKAKVAENFEYFKWAEGERISLKDENKQLRQVLAERDAELAYEKTHRDTTWMVGEPRYQVTKVILVPEKEGGKNKKRGAKVFYDTASAPFMQWTAAMKY